MDINKLVGYCDLGAGIVLASRADDLSFMLIGFVMIFVGSILLA